MGVCAGNAIFDGAFGGGISMGGPFPNRLGRKIGIQISLGFCTIQRAGRLRQRRNFLIMEIPPQDGGGINSKKASLARKNG